MSEHRAAGQEYVPIQTLLARLNRGSEATFRGTLERLQVYGILCIDDDDQLVSFSELGRALTINEPTDTPYREIRLGLIESLFQTVSAKGEKWGFDRLNTLEREAIERLQNDQELHTEVRNTLGADSLRDLCLAVYKNPRPDQPTLIRSIYKGLSGGVMSRSGRNHNFDRLKTAELILYGEDIIRPSQLLSALIKLGVLIEQETTYPIPQVT